MNQPPPGYGPPPSGYGQPQQGYPPQQGYGQQGYPQGPPPKKGMSGWMIALIIVGILALMGIGSCVVCVALVGKAASDAQKAGPAPTTGGATASKPVAADPCSVASRGCLWADQTRTKLLVVQPKQLWADYKANEVSADEKYKDKLFATGGAASSITKDAFGNMIVSFSTDAYGLESVMATLKDDQKAKAMSITKGSPCAVQCVGGGMIMGSPMLSDCKLITAADLPAPQPAPAAPASKKR